MDRDAGAPGPGTDGCRGPDFDSSIDAGELCHLTTPESITRDSGSSESIAVTRPDARCASESRSPCESFSSRSVGDDGSKRHFHDAAIPAQAIEHMAWQITLLQKNQGQGLR
jgi:hypothetical protein